MSNESAPSVETVMAELRELAKRGGLHIEGNEILYSEDARICGDEPLACVDRWLCVRDGAIRMQVRVLARGSVNASWECISDSGFSEPLTKEQAASLVSHWAVLQQAAGDRFAAYQREKAELDYAFPLRHQRQSQG
jgi:hypothetical protein